MLADASLVPAFIRLCGATFGHGCAMGLQASRVCRCPVSVWPCCAGSGWQRAARQVTLPETLVVGKGCFFATGNILTIVDVDKGQFKVPCITHMSRPDEQHHGWCLCFLFFSRVGRFGPWP